MIWFVFISVAIALGVLVMMFDEISSGFYRWADYIVTSMLLFVTGGILYFLAGFIPLSPTIWLLLFLPLKILFVFGVMVMMWGGTLTLGSLVIRLTSYKKQP